MMTMMEKNSCMRWLLLYMACWDKARDELNENWYNLSRSTFEWHMYTYILTLWIKGGGSSSRSEEEGVHDLILEEQKKVVALFLEFLKMTYFGQKSTFSAQKLTFFKDAKNISQIWWPLQDGYQDGGEGGGYHPSSQEGG